MPLGGESFLLRTAGCEHIRSTEPAFLEREKEIPMGGSPGGSVKESLDPKDQQGRAQ